MLVSEIVVGFSKLREFEELGDFGGCEPNNGGHGQDEGERCHFSGRVGACGVFCLGSVPLIVQSAMLKRKRRSNAHLLIRS